ncbi:hypothetical protein L6452_07514 [Arctium lappa]|uniref:Uncharacterized protein n=1 Tax=Arctium lappa TaxID=4217 RepID=A0ACB9EL70_ARCLA|nr:hypothetical protein L6452_07514 [Arctium lappa]
MRLRFVTKSWRRRFLGGEFVPGGDDFRRSPYKNTTGNAQRTSDWEKRRHTTDVIQSHLSIISEAATSGIVSHTPRTLLEIWYFQSLIMRLFTVYR